MTARDWIFVALGIFSAGFVWIWFRGKGRAPGVPTLFELLLGFGTNFFDTLGIGSFAPTTAIFKFRRMVPDEEIPGTLNVGHSPPTLLEAFLFIAFVQVDPVTLVSMMAASVCGAWFGAGVVGRWPRRKVQIGMGAALLTAAFFFLMTNLNISLVPEGTALALNGWKLWAGIAGDFVLGAFMTLGIGLFAPCMILVSLLGMDPKAAYPIMMGSCSFLMPVASVRFIQLDRYSARPALGLALGGLPGVLIAALIVKALPLYWVRWLVVVAVTYASVTMLRSAARERQQSYAMVRTSTDL